MGEHVHNWQPAGTVALYRCEGCHAFGYKPGPRTGFGGAAIRVVCCRRARCEAFAVVLHRVVGGRRVRDPRCAQHREVSRG